MPSSDAILFYDGTCGFCSGVVQFILKHERGHSLRFGALQGNTAATLKQKQPDLSNVDSVIWYEPAQPGRTERVLVLSDAGLAAAAYLGGMWRILAAPARWIPRFIRDAVYRLIARNRKRIARNDSCFVPTPEVRARFID